MKRKSDHGNNRGNFNLEIQRNAHYLVTIALDFSPSKKVRN